MTDILEKVIQTGDEAGRSDRAGLAKLLRDAADEITSLRARLEITHITNANGERVPMPDEMKHYDGIECRDETIRLLEACIISIRFAVLEEVSKKVDVAMLAVMEMVDVHVLALARGIAHAIRALKDKP